MQKNFNQCLHYYTEHNLITEHNLDHNRLDFSML